MFLAWSLILFYHCILHYQWELQTGYVFPRLVQELKDA
jgi:hypothetical protein